MLYHVKWNVKFCQICHKFRQAEIIGILLEQFNDKEKYLL